jgi:hypothetical protein
MQSESTHLVCRGDAVKSLGDGKVGGWLVRFGSPDQTDLSKDRDFFTKDTDFGPFKQSAILYFHGKNPEVGRRTLAIGKIAMKDADGESGIWIEGQLALRDKYERAIAAMATKNKLGWSSGTAPHLVEKVAQKNGSNLITKWPLGLDATLTPIPAEPRAEAYAIKSLEDLVEPEGFLKALHIGDNAEHYATMAGVRSLGDSLHMTMYHHLTDSKKTPAEKSIACMKALGEHHDLAARCVKSMAAGDDADGAQVGAELKSILAGSLERVAATRSLGLHAETVATAVKALNARCLRRLDSRARDGRAFPAAALEDLKLAHAGLSTLLETAAKSLPAATQLSASSLMAELLQIEAGVRFNHA